MEASAAPFAEVEKEAEGAIANERGVVVAMEEGTRRAVRKMADEDWMKREEDMMGVVGTGGDWGLIDTRQRREPRSTNVKAGQEGRGGRRRRNPGLLTRAVWASAFAARSQVGQGGVGWGSLRGSRSEPPLGGRSNRNKGGKADEPMMGDERLG